jgi:hypothetical protein
MHVAPIPLELEKKLGELMRAVQDSRNAQELHFRSLDGQVPPLQNMPVMNRLLLPMAMATIILLIIISYFF